MPDAAGGGGRGGAGRVGVGGVAEVGERLAVDHGALRGVHVPREPEDVGVLLVFLNVTCVTMTDEFEIKTCTPCPDHSFISVW